MKKGTDRGRSVCSFVYAAKTIGVSLSLLLACTAMGTSFVVHEVVHAEENRKPLAAVTATTEPLAAVAVTVQTAEKAEPLTAVSVKAEPLTAVAVETAKAEPLEATSLIPEVKRPDSYVNDYLGFTRTELVSYLVENADAYLGTPYKEETVAPVLGTDGHMQCEGFIWDVMRSVATRNETDIPCGNIRTEPANGGGWVNWSYYHHVDPITFNTKEEMLASGILEKGDVIWSFDAAGPYGLSNSNHVGFFWGDDPHDDKFWESADATGAGFFAGSADGNRIAGIESMTAYPSVWWVFKLSPDTGYDPVVWAGLPEAGTTDPSDKTDEEDKEEKDKEDTTENTGENTAENTTEDTVEQPMEDIPEETGTDPAGEAQPEEAEMPEAAEQIREPEPEPEAETADSAAGDVISGSNVPQSTGEIVFYNGDTEEKGYYTSFGADEYYSYGY